MLTRTLKIAALVSAAWFTTAASAGELTVFSGPGFQGQNLTLRGDMRDLRPSGFNDRIGSMIVRSGRWEVCLDLDFRGDCRVFGPGEYRSRDRWTVRVTAIRAMDGGRDGDYRDGAYRDDNERGGRGRGRGRGRESIEMFSAPNFGGERFQVRRDMRQLDRSTFDDRAASLIVHGGQWEVCQHPDFGGRCRVFGEGEYPTLERGLNRAITSVRQVASDRDGRGDGRGEGRGGYDDQRDGIEMFSAPGFGGQSFQVRQDVRQLGPNTFDDRATSLIVYSGEWALCQHPNFGGQCMTYGPGRYDNLGRMNNQVTSIRRVR
jgi:hypothetical protein